MKSRKSLYLLLIFAILFTLAHAAPGPVAAAPQELLAGVIFSENFNDGDLTNNPTWTLNEPGGYTMVNGELHSDGLDLDTSDRYIKWYNYSLNVTTTDYIEISYRGQLKSTGNPQVGRGVQFMLGGPSGSYSLSIMNGYNSSWPTNQQSISLVTDPVNNPTTLIATSYAPAYNQMYHARAIRKGGVWYLFVDGVLVNKVNDPLSLTTFDGLYLITIGSVVVDDIVVRDDPGTSGMLIEEFDSTSGFTFTDPDLTISGGAANAAVSRSGGAQWLYRSIPNMSGDIRLTVKGKVNSYNNNCHVRAGIGPSVGQGIMTGWGYTGGGCGIFNASIVGDGANFDYYEASCQYSGNWLWINKGTQYIATYTVSGTNARLSVDGVGATTGPLTYNGSYNTLYVGMQGDGDWPSCSASIDTIIIEPLNQVTTYAISGALREAGTNAAIPGATVSDGQGHTATTDANGNYTMMELPAGTYSLSASKPGYTFNGPFNITVPPSATNQNFTGTLITYSISGRVVDLSGSVLSGVTLADGLGHSTMSDITGNYIITGLPSGSYTLTATRSGYTCGPTSPGMDSATLPPNATGKDFTCAPASSTVFFDDFNDNNITANPVWRVNEAGGYTVANGELLSDGLHQDQSDRYIKWFYSDNVFSATNYLEISYRGRLKSAGNPQAGRGIQFNVYATNGSAYKLSIMNGYNSGFAVKQNAITLESVPPNNPSTLLYTNYAPAFDRMYNVRAIRTDGVWYMFVDGVLISKANDPLSLTSFNQMVLITVGSIAMDDVKVRNAPGPDSPLIEEFNSASGFTITDPDLTISGGTANASVSRSGGTQWLYRSIPAFRGDVRLTVKGQINNYTNNCHVKTGIGSDPNQGVSIDWGFFGGGCGTQGTIITGSGVTYDAYENSCVFTGNWLWVNRSTQYISTITVNGSNANLSVGGIGTALGTMNYTGNYDTLYIGLQGDGDWPNCSASFDTVIIEPLGTTYTISGKAATSGGSGITGVTISDGLTRTVVTDASGNYSIPGLSPGTYQLSASKSGYTFSDPLTITIPPDITEQNFTGTPIRYSIAGRVVDGSGASLSGVTISDGQGHTAISDAGGNYLVSNLPAAVYLLSASIAGYSCAPTSPGMDLANLPPSATNKNFSCTKQWSNRAGIAAGRELAGSAAFGSKVYLFGGTNASGALASVEIYDPATNTWSSGPAMPSAKRIAGAGVIGTKIYVVGGDTKLFSFDPLANTWATLAPIPQAPDSEFGLGVVAGKLYVSKGSQWFYAYDPVMNTWSSLTPVSVNRTISSFAVLDNKLYAIGGTVTGATPSETTRIDIYNPVTNTWQLNVLPAAVTPRARLGRSSPVVDGRIYVIGGWNGSSETNGVESYAASVWNNQAAMPTARYNLTYAAVGRRIYAIGGNYGSTGGHYLNTVEELSTTGSVYSISGIVKNDSGSPVPGALVTAGDGLVALTGSDGRFTIGSLLGANYLVKASKTGSTCQPQAGLNLTVPPSNANANFTCTPDGTRWTFMMYLSGDNELGPRLVKVIKNMEKVANNPNVTVLALLDGALDGDTNLYRIQYDSTSSSVVSTPIKVSWNPGELNMGSPDTLVSFVNWARASYPADRYMLSIVGHGRGTSFIATDLVSNGDHITTDVELQQAFAAITNNGAAKIDVLFMDACMMDMAEVLYELDGYVNYTVASENITWTTFPYDGYMSKVSTNTTDLQLAKSIAEVYFTKLSTTPGTIAVIDMSKLAALKTSIDTLSASISAWLDEGGLGPLTQAKDVRDAVQVFDSRDYYVLNDKDEYIDLYDYARLLKEKITNTTIQAQAQALMTTIGTVVVYERHQAGQDVWTKNYLDLKNAHGISVYYPPRSGGFDYTQYTSAQVWNFTNLTHWDEMLVSYFALTGLPPQEYDGDPGVASLYQVKYFINLPTIHR